MAGDLAQSVAREVERLLSKENLAVDQTLAAALNPQLFVRLQVLLRQSSIQALTTDPLVLVAAAKASETLGLSDDETMIRPRLKSKRNTMILRELGTVKEADIRDLLKKGPAATIEAITAEVNDTWFVTLETEQQTQDMAWWIRTQKLNGQTVKVAIKTEHFLRSFFSAPAQGTTPDMMKGGGKGFPDMMKGGGGKAPNFGAGPKGGYPGGMAGGMAGGMFGSGHWQPWKGGGFKGDGAVEAGVAMPILADQANLPAHILDNVGHGRGRGGQPGPKGQAKGKGKGKGKGKQSEVDESLLTTMGQLDLGGGADEGPMIGGYKHEYRAYSRSEIQTICAKAKVELPESLSKKEYADMVVTDAMGWAGEGSPKATPKASPKVGPKA